jgi:hypothetical protein
MLFPVTPATRALIWRSNERFWPGFGRGSRSWDLVLSLPGSDCFLREMALQNPAVKDPHASLSLPAGIALIAIGIIVTVVAAVRYHRRIHALDRDEFRQTFDTGFAFLVAGLLALIGLSVTIYLAVMFLSHEQTG